LVVDRNLILVQRHTVTGPATLLRQSRFRAVDEHVTHRDGRDREEVRSVAPLGVRLVRELDVRLVNQTGRRERSTAGSNGELTAGNRAEMLVHDRYELVERISRRASQRLRSIRTVAG
jgi:hypothetical protein